MAEPTGHKRDASTASNDALMESDLQNIAAGATTPPRVLSQRQSYREPTTAFGRFLKSIDDKVDNSVVGRYFKVSLKEGTRWICLLLPLLPRLRVFMSNFHHFFLSLHRSPPPLDINTNFNTTLPPTTTTTTTFQITERGSTFSTEVIGGVAAFLTLAYVCPVTAAMIADTGATCPLDAPDSEYYCELVVIMMVGGGGN